MDNLIKSLLDRISDIDNEILELDGQVDLNEAKDTDLDKAIKDNSVRYFHYFVFQ